MRVVSCQWGEVNISEVQIVRNYQNHTTMTPYTKHQWYRDNVYFFSVRLLSVLRGHSGFHPHHNGQCPPTPICIPDLIHYIIFLCLSLRKSQYFPFQCWVQHKGTTGTIFIMSLVWRDPWLEIEPGTSRTRCQHSTTRLSRRRWSVTVCWLVLLALLLSSKPQSAWHTFTSLT